MITAIFVHVSTSAAMFAQNGKDFLFSTDLVMSNKLREVVGHWPGLAFGKVKSVRGNLGLLPFKCMHYHQCLLRNED